MSATLIEPGSQAPQRYGKDPPLSECPEPIAIVGMGERPILDCVNVSEGTAADDKFKVVVSPAGLQIHPNFGICLLANEADIRISHQIELISMDSIIPIKTDPEACIPKVGIS